jgi:DNA-binding response OmpR family regulator
MEGKGGPRKVEAQAPLVFSVGLESRDAAVLSFEAEGLGVRAAHLACLHEAGNPDDKPLFVVLSAENSHTADTLAVCRAIRAGLADVWIFVISAHEDPMLEHCALAAGADEVVACPERLRPMLVRLQGLLYRADRASTRDQLIAGRLVVSRTARQAHLAGRPLGLTKAEFALVEHLVLHQHRVVPATELMRTVHGRNVSVRTIQQHVRNIRLKMNPENPNDCPILTQRAEGYRVDADWAPKRERQSGVSELTPLKRAQ